jgi:hypothetical protein
MKYQSGTKMHLWGGEKAKIVSTYCNAHDAAYYVRGLGWEGVMSQVRRTAKKRSISSPAEAAVLLFENAELRKTAAELMLQTAILREALLSTQAGGSVAAITENLPARRPFDS